MTVLQRGLTSGDVADTYLSRYHSSLSFGGSSRMDFDLGNYAPLIRFATFVPEGGPIPQDAIIESATLSVHKGAYDNVIALHAMKINWVESEATWNQAQDGVNWTVAGARGAGSDYEAEPDAQVSSPWNSGWVSFDVTARLQAVATGLPNYGWRMLQLSGNGNRKELRSSEYITDASLRPKLKITWRIAED
ncbi:DNRLRE domain-containing protein [Kineobactrum salinum]|uniref:DNRLRE domain-containing protein n=1 Tax=Kineobactrum salinum TaxID=2708301 RepID=A0A6C0U6F0_9GAMM|nr:DNRLRE domain-containing protein [Kineobactrum salinum]